MSVYAIYRLESIIHEMDGLIETAQGATLVAMKEARWHLKDALKMAKAAEKQEKEAKP